jgi:hypothetical protein
MSDLGWYRGETGQAHLARRQEGGDLSSICGLRGREWVRVRKPRKGSKCQKCFTRNFKWEREAKRRASR